MLSRDVGNDCVLIGLESLFVVESSFLFWFEEQSSFVRILLDIIGTLIGDELREIAGSVFTSDDPSSFLFMIEALILFWIEIVTLLSKAESQLPY